MIKLIAIEDMKTLPTLVLLALLSCDSKVKPNTLSAASRGSANSNIIDKFLGEWTVDASCDGSIVCNMCRKIVFKPNSIGEVTNFGALDFGAWEIRGDRLKISFSNKDIINTGEYSFTFEETKTFATLTLINVKNSDCHKLSR